METESKIFEIFIDDIIPNRFQPRLSFDDDKIGELSESIKIHGIIQPLVLRRIGDKYEIVAGERRYKAATMAGLMKVPAIISNLDDNQSAEIALVENIQRKNLSSIEEAKSFKKLLDRGYINQDQLAAKMGMSQSSVSNKLRLLNLDEEVQRALLDERISERHARSLLAIEDFSKQKELLNQIQLKRLTVRQLDEEIKQMKTELIGPNDFSNTSVEKFDMPAILNGNISINEDVLPQPEFDLNNLPLESVLEELDLKIEEKPKESFVDISSLINKTSNEYFNNSEPVEAQNKLEFLNIPTLEELAIFTQPLENFIEKEPVIEDNPILNDENSMEEVFVPFDDTLQENKVEEFKISDGLPTIVEENIINNDEKTQLSIKIDKSNFRTVEKVFEEVKGKIIEAGLKIDMDTYNFDEYYQLIIKIYK